MASPLNGVLATLKACVISNPDGVDEENLNVEYRQLMGSNIPWRDLGFKSLQDLIRSSPNLQIITRGSRRLVVAETSSVKHLSSMIAQQKKPTTRKRAPRLNKFFQKKLASSRNASSFRGGGGNIRGPLANSSSKNKVPSLMKMDFVENNNVANRNATVSKDVHQYANARPAGESSSSGSSSPTLISPPKPQPAKPVLKPPSQPPKLQLPKQQPSKPVKTKPNEIPAKLPKKSEPLPPNKPAAVLSIVKEKPMKSEQFPQIKPSLLRQVVPTVPAVNMNPTPKLSMFTVPSQPVMAKVPDLIPSQPNIYFSPTPPINLQNSFIPENLVPPKPMKVSTSRGGKRMTARKLMSIKDDSTPSEDSLTAKFINLIKAQEWPDPEYRLLPRTVSRKNTVYGCTVRGSYSLDNNETLLTYDYSTIPDEYTDMVASKEAASQKAFDDMSNKIKETSNYVPVTSDVDLMLNRIYEIVTAFPNGLWAYKVESDYKAKYSERLPSKWADLTVTCNFLLAEKLADFSYVIRPAEKMNIENKEINHLEMGEFHYPDSETWDIYITKIVSSKEVWFRFVGLKYSDWLDEVTKEMCDHYSDWPLFVCSSPVIGEVYVYPTSYGPVRVQVVSLDSPDIATVMHIDHGEVEEVPISHLCILDINFRKLPPQAICCRMYDLDEYEGNSLCNAYLLDKLEGMVLVAEIVQTEPLELVMFDTSLDEPINLNQEILNLLRIDITAPPSLSNGLSVQEGVVTSIWKTGDIYLQLPNDGLRHLNEQLSSLADISPDLYIDNPEEILTDILYLVEVDEMWLRASVLPPARPINNMVELHLIDTGDIKTCRYTDLVPLTLISMVLCEIPKQGVRVRLSGVNIYENTAEKLLSLLPPPCNTIVKVNSLNSSPEVELFIRESKGLISVNNTVQIEEKLSNNLHNISIDSSSTEYTTIKPAPMPDFEEFLDVYVVSVSHPTNFTVIPLKYIQELTKLQNRLQNFYGSIDPGTHKLRNFSIGQACAIQHSDGQWYRGLIEQIMDRSMSQLMIRLCDFGNFAMISSDRLHSLDRKFLNLPALGFSASLANIKPLTHDWEFSDCIQAQKLMLEKNLVTVIKDKIENNGQIALKLQVFDTSGDKDCDIGDLFVNELRAKYEY